MVGAVSQPRTTSPPNGPKSTATIAPRVAVHSPTGAAAAGGVARKVTQAARKIRNADACAAQGPGLAPVTWRPRCSVSTPGPPGRLTGAGRTWLEASGAGRPRRTEADRTTP